MKNILFTTLLFLSTIAFAQQNISSKAKMTDITVYVNQAMVNSKVNVAFPGGRSIIEVTDLPSTIDQNSIKVGGRGNFVLLSVNFEKDFISKKQKAFQVSLEEVQDKIDITEMKLEVNKDEQKMVMDNTEIKSDNDDLYSADLEEMSVYFKKKLTQLGEERLALKKELKRLNEEKEGIQKQMQTDPSRNLPMGKVLLTIQAERAGKAELDLSCLVYNTGWSPSYDLRVENTDSPIELSYKAEVRQNTGVDWEDVKLTLSTARVNRRTVKPELNPTYLYFYENRPPVPMRARSAKMEDAAMAPAMEMVEAEVGSAADFSELVETTLNKQFVISLPYTIKSGTPETVEVQQESIKADYITYATPRFDTNGFLVAEIEAWEQYGFIPAQGNVYFEGAFVGKTYLSDPGTGKKMKISLGRDERLTVERKEIKDFKQRRTFGSNIRESFGYEIILSNSRAKPLKVKVEDQVPVSQDSDITVDIEEKGNGVLKPETGVITWDIEVSGNGEVKISLKYEVKYPKDKQVANL
ncbi:DUF4139 domain-containing protein [Jiulongibacter sediminis]|jgi:uncharacterized protein (TIGR02231 family)|uniref:DUF4139 domain-containing protein n=1 Tax=Jiulongibacter sediminis TaxID=1605367 RepID=UPI0026F31294|nr:DUF4139 domain-containing protein [Jiulongibacter sediminis]